MILSYFKLIYLYFCLKPWNTYTKFFFINTTLIASYQTSWYVLLVIYLNLFIFSSLLPSLEQRFQKELLNFFKSNNWSVSESDVKILYPYILRQYSVLFFFMERLQCQYILKYNIKLIENFERISKSFLKETNENKWSWLIWTSDYLPSEYSDHLFKLHQFWNLNEIPSAGLKNFANNPKMVEVISQNLINNNLRLFKSFSLTEEEIHTLFKKNTHFIQAHYSFINNNDASDFLRYITGQKKIMFLKTKIRDHLILNFENTFKILNLVYLFDLNVDVALNILGQNTPTPWAVGRLFSIFDKYKVNLVKKILKSRYTDKKILDLLIDNRIDQINLSLVISLIKLWDADLPDKVKTLSDFNTHDNHIEALNRWESLTIPKNGFEKQISSNFFYKNSFYHIHFLKNVEEFYAAGIALQNCLYTHDYFYKTYNGLNSVFLIKDECCRPILAVEINFKGRIVQTSGINYTINSEPDMLKFINDLKPQNMVIAYCNALFKKVFLFFWSIYYNAVKKISFFYKLIKIILL